MRRKAYIENKRRISNIPLWILIVMLTLYITGLCTAEAATDSSIKLNMTAASLYTKGALTLKATLTGSNKKVTWKSSNTKVAVVNSSGKVTGKKAGTATITAKANGKTVTCKITVKNPSIKLNKSSATIYTVYDSLT